MGLGDGKRMYGKSSLDEPTGTKKYSLAPVSAGEKAAARERKTNNLIDRNLQRAMRSGSPEARLAAGQLYQKRSSTPGYQQGGGITRADDNREADRITASNYTKEGLQLKNNSNQNVNPGTTQDANDVERGPVNPSGRALQGSQPRAAETQDAYDTRNSTRAGPYMLTGRPNSVSPVDTRNGPDPDITAGSSAAPYTNTPTLSQKPSGATNSKSETLINEYAQAALSQNSNIYKEGVKPDNVAGGLAATQGVGNANNPVPTATTSPATPNTPATRDTMADRAKSKIAGYQESTDAAKIKFSDDLLAYGKSTERTPEKDAKIREYGKTLNLNEDQINAAMRGDTKLDAKSAAASTLAYEKNVTDKAANKTKEELPAIKKARIAGEAAKAAFEKEFIDVDTKETKRDLDYLRSKTEKAAAESQAARDVTAAASKEVGIANKKIEERKANEPARVAKMEKDYEDRRKANEIIKAGSDLNMQDILRNSEDAKIQNGTAVSILSTKARDIKSPEFDLAAFEARNSNDLNFGQKVYKSQYDKDGNFTQQPNDPNDPAFGLLYESDKEKTALEKAGMALGEYNKNLSLSNIANYAKAYVGLTANNAGVSIPESVLQFEASEPSSFEQKTIPKPNSSKQKVEPSGITGLDGPPQKPYYEIPVGKPSAPLRPQPVLKRPFSNPQASVNTKRSIQKSVTDVLSFSDNLNKYLV